MKRLAIAAALVGVVLLGGCGGDDQAPDASDAESSGSPSPSYVESTGCRDEGAALLEDAETVLTAGTADEVDRYAAFVAKDHYPSCAGSSVNALAHVTEAVQRLQAQIVGCQWQQQMLGASDQSGLGCVRVDRAFANVDRMIDEAHEILDATS